LPRFADLGDLSRFNLNGFAYLNERKNITFRAEFHDDSVDDREGERQCDSERGSQSQGRFNSHISLERGDVRLDDIHPDTAARGAGNLFLGRKPRSKNQLIGLLVINSMLILPAAAARNIARNISSYTLTAVVISLVSGVAGLVCSYYWGTATGATIVLISMGFFILSLIWRIRR